MAFKNTQQAHLVLKELLTLLEVELKCKNFGISPQGILVKVEDERRRPVVLHEMRQKTLQENLNVSIGGHVGIQRTVDLVKRTYWWRGLWSDVAQCMQSCPVST